MQRKIPFPEQEPERGARQSACISGHQPVKTFFDKLPPAEPVVFHMRAKPWTTSSALAGARYDLPFA